MIIKELGIIDIAAVAKIHRKAFSKFFLTQLGYKFLIEFYKSIFKNSLSIRIGLFDELTLIGFAVGSKRSKFFYKNLLKKNFFRLGVSALIPLIKNPNHIRRLFASLKASNKSELNYPDEATLLSICVDPEYAAMGYGKILLKEFENVAFKYSSFITLTTDANENEIVKSFYVKNGYKLHHSFMQDQRKMNYYIKTK